MPPQSAASATASSAVNCSSTEFYLSRIPGSGAKKVTAVRASDGDEGKRCRPHSPTQLQCDGYPRLHLARVVRLRAHPVPQPLSLGKSARPRLGDGEHVASAFQADLCAEQTS